MPSYTETVAEETTDHVGQILAAWRTQRPELDVSPVGVFGRITRIERRKDAALRPVHKRHQLDAGEYDVLAALRRSGPHQLTPTQLYRDTLVTSATMTERLDRLERRGLITRHPAPRDRRSVLIELTGPGLALADAAASDVVDAEAALLIGLDAGDRAALAGLLAKLAAALEDTPE
jgi:DNA-binding MarR family transcriptional regulator